MLFDCLNAGRRDMVTITFLNESGKCTGLEASGHAGYGPEGSDIVCAAVSALVQGTMLSINRLTVLESIQQRAGGKLVFRIRDPDETTQILFASLELALTEMQAEYGAFIEVCHG